MLWFDEFEVGATIELGAHLFSADEIIGFARQFDPQPFHVSEAAGKASIFGGLAASGWQSVAIWQALVTTRETALRTSAIAAGVSVPPEVLMPSVSDLRWLKPVLAGDTVTYRMSVREADPAVGLPGWGIVIWRSEGINQRGDLALHFNARRFAKIRE